MSYKMYSQKPQHMVHILIKSIQNSNKTYDKGLVET